MLLKAVRTKVDDKRATDCRRSESGRSGQNIRTKSLGLLEEQRKLRREMIAEQRKIMALPERQYKKMVKMDEKQRELEIKLRSKKEKKELSELGMLDIYDEKKIERRIESTSRRFANEKPTDGENARENGESLLGKVTRRRGRKSKENGSVEIKRHRSIQKTISGSGENEREHRGIPCRCGW